MYFQKNQTKEIIKAFWQNGFRDFSKEIFILHDYKTYTANTGITLNRSLYDVHHIRPLAYGGSNAYGNLIHLPKATHTKVTGWWAGY